VHDHVNGRVLPYADQRLLIPSKGCDYQWLVMHSKQVLLEIGDQDFDKIVRSAACKSEGCLHFVSYDH
jgi:hypothetical protein